jgi:hypothetical protein
VKAYRAKFHIRCTDSYKAYYLCVDSPLSATDPCLQQDNHSPKANDLPAQPYVR